MPYEIPVFTLIVAADAKKTRPPSTSRIEAMIGDRMESAAFPDLLGATSSNWWLQTELLSLAEHLRADGLRFLQAPSALLRSDDQRTAIAALDSVLAHILSPSRPATDDLPSNAFEGLDLPSVVSTPPGTELDADSGFPSPGAAFVAYVAALRTVLSAALEKQGHVIHYRPEP